MGLVPIDKLPDELLPGSKVLIEAQAQVSQVPTFLAVGVMRGTGTAVAGKPAIVSSAARARKLFGEGSSVANQCIAFLKHKQSVECWALPLAEPKGGTAAVWSIGVTGAATAAGTITRYFNGVAVNVAVRVGDDAAAVGAKFVAAINSKADLPVEASYAAGALKLTAHCKGQYVELRVDKKSTDPAGLTLANMAASAAGAGLVDLSAVFAADTTSRWNYFSTDIFDSQAQVFWQKELKDRYDPNRQIDGRLFVCLSGAVGDAGTAGSMIYQAKTINSPHMVLIPRGVGNYQDSAGIAASWAAGAGGVMALDPTANLRGREIGGFAPQVSYSEAEREALLKAGIACYKRDKLGSGTFERVVTSYNEAPDGARDTSYLDLFRVLIRLDVNNTLKSRIDNEK